MGGANNTIFHSSTVYLRGIVETSAYVIYVRRFSTSCIHHINECNGTSFRHSNPNIIEISGKDTHCLLEEDQNRIYYRCPDEDVPKWITKGRRKTNE